MAADLAELVAGWPLAGGSIVVIPLLEHGYGWLPQSAAIRSYPGLDDELPVGWQNCAGDRDLGF
jgi:hypothetical protein